MTTKELIRKKFADLYMEYKEKFHQTGDSYFLGIIDGLDMTNRVLNTLPDEPVTDCNDLEKEYKEYVDNNPVFSKLVNRNAGISIARHFAEWGAEHLRDATKKISEDLEAE